MKMKGIYKLAVILASVAILLPAKASAQSPILENSFVSVGAGINATVLHPLSPKTWGNIGLATDINVGKWWNPYVGTRLGFHGGWNNCKQELNKETIPANTPFGFNYMHVDVLASFTDGVIGPDEDRIWNVAFYLNTGALKVSYSRSFFSKGAYAWGFGAGMLNEFKITPEVSIIADLQAIAANPSAFSENGGRLVIFPTATVGISFNLGEIF